MTDLDLSKLRIKMEKDSERFAHTLLPPKTLLALLDRLEKAEKAAAVFFEAGYQTVKEAQAKLEQAESILREIAGGGIPGTPQRARDYFKQTEQVKT